MTNGVAAAEDLVHPPGEDRRWRESYYFSFFDPVRRIGGFSSVGKRAATGHSGSINVIWGPERQSLVASEFDTFEALDDNHDVAGLRYRAREPFGVWEVSFDGKLNAGGSGVECDRAALGPAGQGGAGAGDAGAGAGPGTVPVHYELTFTPSHPPYLYRARPEWSELFTGHVDEVCTVRGTLTVGEETIEINGRGGKDHSWGVRNWFAPVAWRWFDLVAAAGPDPAGPRAPELTMWRGAFSPGEWISDGAVFSGGAAIPLERYAETVTTLDVPGRPKPLPSTVRAELTAGGHDYGFTGQVRRVLPVLFTKNDRVSWNDRALVECTFNDGTLAWANVEFAEGLAAP